MSALPSELTPVDIVGRSSGSRSFRASECFGDFLLCFAAGLLPSKPVGINLSRRKAYSVGPRLFLKQRAKRESGAYMVQMRLDLIFYSWKRWS